MKVLVPLPARDFDPSEVAVSWKILRAAGHELTFATPDGDSAQADPVMLNGEGLDPWGRVPALRRFIVVGDLLRANKAARAAYAELERDREFNNPLRHAELHAGMFDALLLPGGHAQGMRPYLESEKLQSVVADFFDANQPVAAICHGVVLAARSISRRTGKSVLHGLRTTALTWKLEKSAWDLTRLALRRWDPGYYRTYAEAPGEAPGYRSVQAEVTRALARPEDFADVPGDAPHAVRKKSGLFRDSASDARPAFVVRERNYVSARWPGDVHTFAKTFAELLAERAKRGTKS